MIPDFSSSLSLFVHYWTIAKLKRDYEKKEMEKRGKEETSCCPLEEVCSIPFFAINLCFSLLRFSSLPFFRTHSLIVETSLPLSLSLSEPFFLFLLFLLRKRRQAPSLPPPTTSLFSFPPVNMSNLKGAPSSSFVQARKRRREKRD